MNIGDSIDFQYYDRDFLGIESIGIILKIFNKKNSKDFAIFLLKKETGEDMFRDMFHLVFNLNYEFYEVLYGNKKILISQKILKK